MTIQAIQPAAAETDWPAEEDYGPPDSLRSAHQRGWKEGYAAALQDLAERKAMQREVIDQALVQRFAEILADLRQRAA
jgi:hypothetical protein